MGVGEAGLRWHPGYWHLCSMAARVRWPRLAHWEGTGALPLAGSPGALISRQGCRRGRGALRTRAAQAQAPCLVLDQSPHGRPAPPRTRSGLHLESSTYPGSACSQQPNSGGTPLPSPPDRPAKPLLHPQKAGPPDHTGSHGRQFFQLLDPLPQGPESHPPSPRSGSSLSSPRGAAGSVTPEKAAAGLRPRLSQSPLPGAGAGAWAPETNSRSCRELGGQARPAARAQEVLPGTAGGF